MRVGLTPSDRQACVDQQDTAVSPWCQQSALVGRRLVIWILLLECFVDVLEGWRRGVGRTNGEAEAVSLVGAVVGVLACDYDLDGVEGCVPRPVHPSVTLVNI
jgi:hypothetical protein